MSLITAHKILIGTAVAFFAFYGLWELRAYTMSKDWGTLLGAVLSLVVSVGFAAYLRTVKDRRPKNRPTAHP